MESVRINIFELIGNEAAVTSEDGELLCNRISKAFKAEKSALLDFNNIQLITSAFLNAAVGQLYGLYENDFLKKHLKVEHMANEDKILLKKVIERAKEYFKDKEKMENIIREALSDEENNPD